MNIVIEKSIVDDYVQTLSAYNATLKKAQSYQEVLEKRIAHLQDRIESDKMLSIRQACEYLGGINEDTLLYYRRMGLDYYKKGRESVWYSKKDIDDWLASGKVVRRKKQLVH